MTREEILSGAHRSVANRLAEEKSKGFVKYWTPRGDLARPEQSEPKRVPKQITKVTISTDGLRQTFQDCCTQCGDWTLSEADVEELLKRCSAEILHDIFKSLGRFDSDGQSQQRCFDGLEEAINQAVWQAEVTQ